MGLQAWADSVLHHGSGLGTLPHIECHIDIFCTDTHRNQVFQLWSEGLSVNDFEIIGKGGKKAQIKLLVTGDLSK